MIAKNARLGCLLKKIKMKRYSFQSIKWYLTHPGAYREFFLLWVGSIKKIFGIKHDCTRWYKSHSIGYDELLRIIIGGYDVPEDPQLKINTNAQLLYLLAEHLKAVSVVETGVFSGQSSYAFLSSLSRRDGRLVSTDIPTVEKWALPGKVVPDELRTHWEIIQKPDRKSLPVALSRFEAIDMCYYDSDKSYQGRLFAYPLLWKALRRGGIFVSDDINDNYGFRDFCKEINVEPYVIENSGRWVGVIFKAA